MNYTLCVQTRERTAPVQIRALLERKRYAQRKAWLKDKEVSSQNTELLPEESGKPILSPIARALKKFVGARTVAEKNGG